MTENKVNRLVLFDINIEHKGQEFSRDYIKKTIGFRTLNQDNIVKSDFDV